MNTRQIIYDLYAKSKQDPHAKKAWEELKLALSLPKEEVKKILSEMYGCELSAGDHHG